VTILEAVGTHLASNGHGTLGTNLFLAVMPDSPDVMTCVYETGGSPPDQVMGSSAWAIDRPSLQIIVRAGQGDYPTARDEAAAIRLLLSGITDQTLSGINVMRILPSGGLLPLGEDPLGRPMVSFNFDCMVLP
jgi:hypothetical protein